ncbi:hypothetical protein [Natrononativus amylolyticus]|uniref:hypothetical protein n=1 Tax=Natrononativus amylolyticus TaxID=2963434 RepID=UPI0020CE3E2F|nr:hypothetical protein [Natrononativus amylolyticus]
MYSASRGILYSAPPAEDEETTDPKRTETRTDLEPTPEEPTVDDTTPTDSRANWTGSVPADD